jgi:hypothetical protein
MSPMALIDHLDAYSAPRLVEYFDDDPYMMAMMEGRVLGATLQAEAPAALSAKRARARRERRATYRVGGVRHP